eukprot:TRINITY_DN103_c1_g7_i2.p1 TRINITY_DN103_c1_g7~~TRINITY_DN103_c1_g7_i2.p1  ORF type:complete len:729 (+),score=254.48 TRINITY_DN103_c1_g7_i2:159-2189(+)
MLAGNFRMGFRITGMALNTGFILCFLNPDDQTVFSKNFKINPNGAAVSAFIGTCLGSVAAIVAVLLPYPLGFSTREMKANGNAASEDMSKLFCSAVEYFCGAKATVLIDRQQAQAGVLKAQIGGLGGAIEDAYVESFDASTQGVTRALYQKHSSMMGEIFDLLNALHIAMASEDFGPSHLECMDAIAGSSMDVVEQASVLLITATKYSDDGKIDRGEAEKLEACEEAVTVAIKTLAEDFSKHRETLGKDKKVCEELMNESFFVFCISSYGRRINAYSKTLRSSDCPKGSSFLSELWAAITGVFTPPMPHHFRVVSRYWWSLMVCFLFSVAIDNYSGACAVTAVFLINTRIGPDVMAMIQGLLAVVVGVVFNALMYSFSCKYASTNVLMGISFFYWIGTITVAKGTSSLAGVGLFMAALAPFAIVTACPAEVTQAIDNAKAVGLWGSIRALLIAVVLTVVFEIVHIPGQFTQLASMELEKAFVALDTAFTAVFNEKDVNKSLSQLSDALGSAEDFNTAAKMEPRLWMCPWKVDFLIETSASLKKLKSDILVIRMALLGDGDTEGGIFGKLAKVAEAEAMKQDIQRTINDAKSLTMDVLTHQGGKFEGLQKLSEVTGLDKLDGYEEALVKINEVVEFPDKVPETMEADELVQLSIVFVMFSYLVQHLSDLLKNAVKLS